jgi:glycosyltransferase involved in cell wall biosynthesis
VCYPFPGDTLGGSHISTLLLANHLDRGAFEPLILVHRDGPLTDHLQQQGIAFRRVPEDWILAYGVGTLPADSLHALPATLAMRRLLRAEGVDIVHVNDNRMGTTWGPAARLAGCGLVWHQRTRPVLSRRMRFFAGLAHRVVCISHYCSEAFDGGRFEGRLRVVRNPFARPAALVDRPAAKQALLSQLDLPAETKVVAFVANILPHKRPLVFVEAARLIAESCEGPVAFVVFGKAEGALSDRMRQRIADLGLAARFHFLGFRDPIEPWLRGCDLLLAPGIEEGFGRTLIEAMLTETPVVAADSGGFREIVEHGVNGLLMPVDDAESFAAAALSVLNDPELGAALAQAALARACEGLDIGAHVAQLAALYREVHEALR